MQMQRARKPLPLAHGDAPPETVESTPLTAMRMQTALKPLPHARDGRVEEHVVDGHADAVGAGAAAARTQRDAARDGRAEDA